MGMKLWKSTDGTAAHTTKIKSINSGGIGPIRIVFVLLVPHFILTANDGTKSFELYKSDGTANRNCFDKRYMGRAGSSMPYGLTNVKR